MYIQSENISIFPIGSGRDNIKDGRLLNEKNLTGIFKALTSKDSYVVSYINRKMSFVLGGYYIECIIPEDEEWTTELYAYMTLENNHIHNNSDTEIENVQVYTGVQFVKDEPQSGYTYKLKLLSGGVVPTESIFKHSGSSLFLNYTDGGTTSEKSAEEYINIYLKKVLGEDVLNANPETTLSEGLAKTYIDTYVDNVFGDTYDPDDTSTLGGIVGSYIDSVFGADFDPDDPSLETLNGIVGSTAASAFNSIRNNEADYFGGEKSSGEEVTGQIPEKFTTLSADVEAYFGNDKPVESEDYVQGIVPQKVSQYFSLTKSEESDYSEGEITSRLERYFGLDDDSDRTPTDSSKGYIQEQLENFINATDAKIEDILKDYTDTLKWKEYPPES